MPSRKTSIPRGFLREHFAGVFHAMENRAWERADRNGPAPFRVKQRMLLDAAIAAGAKILIETGTRFGDMTNALRDKFREIYTMEYDDDLYERAKRTFETRAHIHCLGGSPQELLASILRRISEPCVFWLCSHAPGGQGAARSRVDQELAVIAAHRVKTHAILIDAGGASAGQMEEVRTRSFPGLRLSVEHGIIRLLPNPGS